MSIHKIVWHELYIPVHWRWRSSHVHGWGRWRRGRTQVHSHWTASSPTHVRIRPCSTHAPPTKRDALWDFVRNHYSLTNSDSLKKYKQTEEMSKNMSQNLMGPNPFVKPSRPLPLMWPCGLNPFIIIPRPPRPPRPIRPTLPRLLVPRPLWREIHKQIEISWPRWGQRYGEHNDIIWQQWLWSCDPPGFAIRYRVFLWRCFCDLHHLFSLFHLLRFSFHL